MPNASDNISRPYPGHMVMSSDAITSGHLRPSHAALPAHLLNRQQNSKQRTLSSVENFSIEGVLDYKMYDLAANNVGAPKTANLKPVDSLNSSLGTLTLNDKHGDMTGRLYHNQNGGSHNATEQNKTYYSSYLSKAGCASPTHSHSGSSRESNSPRGSMATASQFYDCKASSPLYENIDSYNSVRLASQVPPYYHQLPLHSSPHSSHSSQDSKHSSPRSSYVASDAHYESNYRKAQPQVPVGAKLTCIPNKEFPPYEAPPVYENLQELSKPTNESARPGPQVAVHGEQRQIAVALTSLKAPYHPVIYSPNISVVSAQPAILETRLQQQMAISRAVSASTVAMGQTSMATSYQRPATSGIASDASPPSPTLSANFKHVAGSGKNLLPYNVTPPRPMGPTEAERKIEELTRQLEEEMEKQEEEGEYFGE